MQRELAGRVDTHSRILDVGCGNGKFLGILSRTLGFENLYGVEYSPVAMESAPAQLKPRILVGDVIELSASLSMNPFDAAVCSEVLEHVDEPPLVVSAIAKTLKPGGLAVFTVPALMRHWSSQDEVAGHQRRFEVDEFKDLLTRAGFNVERQICWGGPLARTYNSFVSRAGPDRVMKSGSNPAVAAFARLVSFMLRLEDLNESPNGFQMVARARKQ
jgi:SAM-dependent methyltransferase